ncbi:MAG: YopX family protein [Helcococcus sp.]|nr:YopX family protein [Helcococcus sp.]
MIPKFRVWDESIRYMDYRARVTTTDDYIKVEVLDAFCDWRKLEKRQYELMQSTGLKDKNGKEIFEGDIVEVSKGFTKIICYSVNEGNWKLRPANKQGACSYFSNYENTAEWEIIGNIYENPELLEVE